MNYMPFAICLAFNIYWVLKYPKVIRNAFLFYDVGSSIILYGYVALSILAGFII